MADRREDDMAAQAWPGFVDILSSTVIMFVFFVMVIVVVLYLYTIKFTATVQQQAEQRIQETIQKSDSPKTLGELEEEKSKKVQEISELEEQKQTIEKEVEALKSKVEQLSSGLEDGKNQAVLIDGNVMTVLFNDNEITLTNESIDSIIEFLSNYSVDQTIAVTSGDNPLAASQSNDRKSVLARMLNTRNVAIDQGFRSSRITIEYVEPEVIKGAYNWVKVKVE